MSQMHWSRRSLLPSVVMRCVIISAILTCVSVLSNGQSQPSSASTPVVARPVGTVKAINGNEIILATGSGPEVTVTTQDSTRIIHTVPGQTDLKNATPMTLEDIQVGDRVLVRGSSSDNGKSVVAASAVVMKQSEIAARQEQERQDWQKRGIGGLVKSVDPTSGSIQVSVASFASTKDVAIHTSKATVVRRYSADSVKFDDAKPGTLAQIKPGDQLRALGMRNTDGTSLEAEEIVSGSFRNIAGTVQSTDPGQNTVSVMDLITKKPVTVKIKPDSQLRQLPVAFAQRIAMRLRGGGASGGEPVATGASSRGGKGSSGAPAEVVSGAPNGGSRGGGFGGGNRPGGPPDFQQMLNRLPAVSLADLHKGDVVMIVTTQGSDVSAPAVITLLSGVEPILTASPNSSRAATLLSPWNLGASPGGDAATE